MFVMNYAFDELYVSMGQKFEIFIMLQKCESSTVITHEFALFFSTIAKNFSCGESKTGYFVKFGIAPYVKDELIESVSNERYVILFDESLNKAIKSKQLDITFDFGTQRTTKWSPITLHRNSLARRKQQIFCKLLRNQC